MKRDLSSAQFVAATEKLGFKYAGWMGYYKLPAPFDNTSVSLINVREVDGKRRHRDCLAYLKRAHANAKRRETCASKITEQVAA